MALFSTVCNIWRCRHHCASALDHFLCQRRLGGKRTVILIWHLFLCFWGAFGRNRFYEYFVISHIPLFAERRTPGSGITPYLALHSAWCRPSSSFDMCFTARARWRERMGSIETLLWGSVETGPQAVSMDPGGLCNGYCSGAVTLKEIVHLWNELLNWNSSLIELNFWPLFLQPFAWKHTIAWDISHFSHPPILP